MIASAPATNIAQVASPQHAAPEVLRRRPWWRPPVDFLAYLIVTVLVLECLLKICGLGQSEFLEPDLDLGCRHIAGKQVTWRLEGYSNDRLSSAGLRDIQHTVAKPPGVIRIALLGDSLAEGLQVPLDKTFGRLVEKLLNNAAARSNARKYEVINFACSSFSTGQELLMLKKQAVYYHPDIVIALYNRGDSDENIFVPGPAALAQPRPCFYLDSAGGLKLDTKLLEACRFKLAPNPVMSFLRKNSRIFGVLSQTHLQMSIDEPRYRKLTALLGNLSTILPFESMRFKPYTVPYPRQNAQKVTSALLTELNAQSKAMHARFVLLMFPNTSGDIALGLDAASFKELSQRDGFGYLDLSQPFLQSRSPKPLFLQYHFSAQGHMVVAEELCRMLCSSHTVVNRTRD